MIICSDDYLLFHYSIVLNSQTGGNHVNAAAMFRVGTGIIGAQSKLMGTVTGGQAGIVPRILHLVVSTQDSPDPCQPHIGSQYFQVAKHVTGGIV